MKIKNIIITAFCAAIVLAAAGCKKEFINSPNFANAYFRMIVMDAPGSGSIQFTLDNKVNANGDSVTYNADGSIYHEDPDMASTAVVNYPSGGWSDNSPLDFAGVYGYYNVPAHLFTYFPNPTDRVGLAPAISKLNFFYWAALPATQHRLTFYSVQNANQYGNIVQVRGPSVYDQPLNLEGGALQTIMLVNKSVCRQYFVAGVNSTHGTGFPYGMTESIQYIGLNFDVVSFKDHPSKLPAFKDTCAYIRFMNVTPIYQDQVLNQNTDLMDIYIAPIYGLRPNFYNSLASNGQTSNLVTSIGDEVLVARNLARFGSQVDQPFYEIPLGAYMRKTASGAPDTAGRPRYFRVLAYRAGQSKAANNQPLAVGDWLSIYNKFPYYLDTPVPFSGSPISGYNIDSFLLRYDGANFHPAITTIPIAVGPDPVPIDNIGNAQPYNYLGYRSIIDYVQVGVNSIYYNH